MIEVINFQHFENIVGKNSPTRLDVMFHTLSDEIQTYLKLEPIHKKVKVILIKEEEPNNLRREEIFNIGVNRYIKNNVLVIEFNENYNKFINFILLREIYNNFIPDKLRRYELIQIVINKIILTQLSRMPLLNDWRSFIREKIEDYDLLSVGVNRLFSFDRLGKLFKFIGAGAPHDPIQFFFRYLREKILLINDNIEDIHEIIFEEFAQYLSRSVNNDTMVETIRCVISIFYNVGNYKSITSYNSYFQEFKNKGLIETDLSLNKFRKNMDRIKTYSYLAPSYQLNWNTINICLISIFLRFHPLLNKEKIYEIMNQLPFFVAPKISHDSFAVDFSGYVVIPKVYLNDFYKFIEKLEDSGYIIRHHCLVFNKHTHIINLEYLREYSKIRRIINPDHIHYNNENEIEFTTDLGSNYYNNKLSLLDFLVLDRIRFYSVSGLGFERKKEAIKRLKSDLLNEVITERAKIKDLRDILKIFRESNYLTMEFMHFLEANQEFGFFYIKKMLETSKTFLKFMEQVLKNNPNIRNYYQFRDIFENQNLSQPIEEIISFKNCCSQIGIFKELFTHFFQSKKEYNKRIETLKKFSDLVNSCYNLKIFNLKSVKKILQDHNVVNQIYKTKEAKLKEDFERLKPYKITMQEVENIINKFSKNNPPIIQPLLLNTIIFSENDYLQLILVKSDVTLKAIEKIKNLFPRVVINSTRSLESNENLLLIEISTPHMFREEKELLYSILYNNLKDLIRYAKSYSWSGMIPALSRKNFYDFSNNQFFYTEDLFEQFFLSVQKTLGKRLKKLPIKVSKTQDKFWSKEKNIKRLIKTMNYHDEREKNDFNVSNLNRLVKFNLSLKKTLLNLENFRDLKTECFFKNHVKSIKFIPAFQRFGFEQFYLYVYPTEMDEVDLKLLLTNTFLKVKYPASIDDSNSLLIKYLMPYRTPNLKYIHWLTKSKKIIREYLAFSVKKIYQIFHFNINLNSREGWIYDLDKFKIYMQEILFNPQYDILIPDINIFDLEEKLESKNLAPNSPEFESLSEIYNWHSIDLKSFLSGKTLLKEKHITDLLKKDLIFPYLTLKNLGFQKKIYILIPKVKKETISLLIKVFSFFNVGLIHEIEGEYYIEGFINEKEFERGLMIEIYFPKCEIGEFEKEFELLFHYLEIEHYLILNDLVDGSNLIKSAFGNLNFLKRYNPLTNLKWNEKDKIWLNTKLFSREGRFIYPDLTFKEKEKNE